MLSCKGCEVEFSPINRNQKYCTRVCRQTKLYRTLNGRVESMWKGMVKRGKVNDRLQITKDEFLSVVDDNLDRLMVLYEDWERDNFSRGMSPSVDRINPDVGYEIGNIQFITQSENASKDNYKRRRNSHGHIPLRATKGDEVLEFKSQLEASEWFGICRKTLRNSVNTKKLLDGWKLEII